MHSTVQSRTDSSLRDTLGNPLVTVIACCYNHSAFVVESLESIRQQTYPHVQLIVTDDASTDDSPALIHEWISRHQMSCTYLRHRTNKGICKTLNEALSHASGQYIAILATDDLWIPDKLEHQVSVMEALPETVGVLYSNAMQINEEGTSLGLIEQHTATWPAEGDILSLLVERNFIPTMTTLVRSACYRTVGLYDQRLCFEDWDMWLRIAQHYHFAYYPKVYAKRRVLSTSMSNTLLKSESPELLKSLFRLNAKLLSSTRLVPAQQSLVVQRLVWFAERLFQQRSRWRTRFLLRAYLADRRHRTLVMGICSLLGMSYPWFWRLLDCLAAARRTVSGDSRFGL